MLHRNPKLSRAITRPTCAVTLVAALLGTACDGDVKGWTMLPNQPGEAGVVDASIEPTEASVQPDPDASPSTTTKPAPATDTVTLEAGATGDDAGTTTCALDCGVATSSDSVTSIADAGATTGDAGTSVCGDSVVEGLEECDDGNSVNNDGCDTACMKSTCGDSVVEGAEACDPPTTSGHCSSTCQFLPPRCGDGVVQAEDGEGCDDGNSVADDGCFECASSCGNGKIDPDETCEPGFASLLCARTWNTCIPCSAGDEDCEARDVCDALTCQGRAACGNGRVEVGESCDPPGSLRCDNRCQQLPKECGNGVIEFGEECDPADGIFCNDECLNISCGNGAVEGQEECDPPNGLTCNASCKSVAACEASPPPASILPVDGAFTTGIEGWLAPDTRVTLTQDTVEGSEAPGALLIALNNGGTGGAPIEIRGATLCLPVSPNTAYSFSGSYKFPAGSSTDSGTSISLYLYSNLSCTGDAIETSKVRGHRGTVSEQWQSYQTAMNTAVVREVGEFLSMMIRVDVWRPAELSAVSVLWDDVELTNAGVQSDGYCGDCLMTGTETCDDGNQIDGDGCNALCIAEGCLNGVVDVGEQCDDGNLTFQDGCDPDCSTGNACRGCAFAQCTEAATACYQDATPVTEGIGSGKSVGQLCSGLAECIERTGCALDTAASSLTGLLTNRKGVENCYCGTARSEDCFEGAANGSCKVEIEAAVETKDPLLVVQRMGISDDTYPAFHHAVSVFNCVSDPLKTCAESCVGQPVCGNGRVGDRPLEFLSSVPGMFDGTESSPLTCEELGNALCFYEQCDDANTTEADGCDAQCYREECGNGVLQPGSGEACDDGNTESDDGCTAACQFEWVCGDEQQDPNEACDDGNDVVGDGCDPKCYKEECGNSVVQINEQCDPPNGSQCLEGCVLAPMDPCTTCLLEMGDEQVSDTQQCVGSLALDGSPDIEIAYKCLADPLCEAVWTCLLETECARLELESGMDSCYCGQGAEVRAECQNNSEFIPQGECATEMIAAYEAQFETPVSNSDMIASMLNYFFESGVRYENPSLAAATVSYQACLGLNSEFSLDLDMCAVGFTPEHRLECSQACFGDAALTEEQIVGEDCLPQSAAQ